MSEENNKTITIFTEGNTRTNGTNSKPTTKKPNVQPSGQKKNGTSTVQSETKKAN